jgi:hypothetical protein
VVTRALERELGDVMWAAYQVGDEVQRTFVDLAFQVAQGSLSSLCEQARSWADQAQDIAVWFGAPGGPEIAWQQGRSNFEVYGLVKNVRERLGLDWSRNTSLTPLVDKAYDLGGYADLWAIEGLGHDYTDLRLDQGVRSSILTDDRAAALPEGTLTMMHAGLGLALAQRMMLRITPYTPRRQVGGELRRFIDDCDANSREGYSGAAYESLGLVTRTWHPQVVRLVDAAFSDVAPELAGYFWHGAGRALYFLPTHIIPGLLSPWRIADREAIHQTARLNLFAGLAWATTLVNLRDPRVTLHLLRVHGRLLDFIGVAAGVASAAVIRLDTTPGDSHVAALADYEPVDADPETRSRWNRLVRQPVRAAIQRYYPVLRAQRRLEAVFQFHDLDELTLDADTSSHFLPSPFVDRGQEAGSA